MGDAHGIDVRRGGRPAMFRAMCVIATVFVAIIASFFTVLAVAPMDPDYSETQSVSYSYGTFEITVEVPEDPGVWVLRFGPASVLSRYVQPDDPAVVAIADAITERYSGDATRVNYAIRLVHNIIEYVSDEESHGADEWRQLPCETLALGTGDCEDFAILCASIIEAMGYRTVLVVSPDHVSIGVAVGDAGTYVDHEGTRYYLADPTGGTALGNSRVRVDAVVPSTPGNGLYVIPAFFIALTLTLAALTVYAFTRM